MATAYTSLLGLALPVTGELQGTWGNTVNDSITSLLDTAVAGTTTLATDGDVTLSTTTGAANQARQAILLCTGSRSAQRTITAPAQSKIYTVINSTTGGFSVKLVGVGPTAGVTVVPGEAVVVAWNGSDFVKVSTFGGAGFFTDLTVSGNSQLGDAAGDTTTVSGPMTLSAGTANGVLYLNGSKVATSGSALVFDGSNLGVNCTTSALTTYRGAEFAGTTATTGGFLRMRTSDSSINSLDFTDSNGRAIFTTTNHPVRFGVNDAEQMRLTSTGLGIGTSSPGTKLDVAAATAIARLTSTTGTNVGYYQVSNTGGGLYIGRDSFAGGGFYTGSPAYGAIFLSTGAYPMAFAVDSVERMRLNSSGNLGLGVTPSAWNANVRAFETIESWASISGNAGSGAGNVATNAFFNTSGSWIYKNTAAASRYQQLSGAHAWYTAPSGTAGNTISFTQAMTLDADGYLLVGTTTRNTDANIPVQINAGSNQLRGFSVNRENSYGISLGYNNITGNDWGELRIVGNKPMVFFTNNTERARITSGGDLLVGTTATILASKFASVAGAAQNGGSFQTTASANNYTAIAGARNGNNGNVAEWWYDLSTQVGTISVTSTATAYNTSSDYRLKDNPQPLTNSGAFIDALQPKTWEWKTDGSRGVGFIAHEVQAVSPGSVVGEKDAVDADGKPVMQAMEYGSAEFIANIIAELQSLRARVQALEAQP